ncbi:MAG: hypothetical protein MUD15_12865 [Desulfobacterota bacterium]|jgi:lauroyl/myristoyl acyltransferase|nr:hypothetical protein [Thermodesulfobacteriota bacterium]
MSITEKTQSAAQYWGTIVMIRIVLALPYRVAIALGRLAGLLLYAALPLRRKIVTIQRLSDFMQSWVTSVVRQYPDQWFWLHSRWIKRSTMNRILRKGLDFREYVLATAHGGTEEEQ